MVRGIVGKDPVNGIIWERVATMVEDSLDG